MADLKDDIEKYLRNELTSVERNALERKALSDPFLAEALEGNESIPPHDFSTDVKHLETLLLKRINKKDNVSVWMWSARIAAGLLIIILASYIYYETSDVKKNSPLALNKVKEQPAIPPSLKKQESASAVTPEASAPKPNATLKNNAAQPRKQQSPPLASSSEREIESAQAAEEIVAASDEPDTDVKPLSEQAVDEKASYDKVQPSIAQTSPALSQRKINKDDREEKKKFKEDAPAIVGPIARGDEVETSSIATVKIIKGKVTQSDDTSPLSGVNVLIKGSAIGTVTNAQGEYELQLDDRDATLVFSFIGLRELEVPATVNDILNVKMEPDVSALSEVVVTGYAAADKNLKEVYISYQLAAPKVGKKNFKKYLTDNLRYPNEAIVNKIEGRVTIQFTVDPSGRTDGFKVLKGIGYGCDEEVIRLIKEGPDWIPSKRNDVPVSDNVKVRLKFTLPKK